MDLQTGRRDRGIEAHRPTARRVKFEGDLVAVLHTREVSDCLLLRPTTRQLDV